MKLLFLRATGQSRLPDLTEYLELSQFNDYWSWDMDDDMQEIKNLFRELESWSLTLIFPKAPDSRDYGRENDWRAPHPNAFRGKLILQFHGALCSFLGAIATGDSNWFDKPTNTMPWSQP